MKIQKKIHFLFVKSLQIYSTIWKFCSLKRFYLNRNTTEFVPCEQLSLKAGRYATKDEKPQRAIVCFSIEHMRQRDAHAKTSNDSTSSWFPRERQKKQKNSFNKQNRSFAPASHFFVHVFPFLHDYDVKMPNFTFNGKLKQATMKFYFSFWTWIRSLRIQLQFGSPTFDKDLTK